MSDNNIEKQDTVYDTHKEHELHLVYQGDCSECYNNPPVVKLNEEGFIVPDLEEEYDDGQGRRYDILDSELE